MRTRSTASTRARSRGISPEARVAPWRRSAVSGFERRIAVHVEDQTFGGHIDEFLVVAHFLEFPAEDLAQPGPLVPAQLVFAAKISDARKNIFEYFRATL